MPKVTLRNLTQMQQNHISGINSALQEIDFGKAVADMATGTDSLDPTVERIRALYGNVGLSLTVGNSTLAVVNAGATMFLNVGGTNAFGSDGVNTFIVVGGQTYVFNLTATGSTIGVN